MSIIKVLLFAALGAFGQWRAAAVVLPPATNQVVLNWDSLGSGTRYYIQTSTNLTTWVAAANTTATNVNLSRTGGPVQVFRLSASNSPPQSVTLAWDANALAEGVAGYFIYYGPATGSYTNRVDAGLATMALVPDLVVGATYYFATTSYSSTGLESECSNEAVWQRPFQLRIQQLP